MTESGTDAAQIRRESARLQPCRKQLIFIPALAAEGFLPHHHRNRMLGPTADRRTNTGLWTAARLVCLSLCLASLAVVALAANPPIAKKAGAQPAHTRPSIILITLDTTRADRMGFLGSERGLTPNLDALARESVVFTHAYSQVPLTPASHASILTGTYPQFHHINEFKAELAEDLPYAPAILGAQGYHTGAFVGSIILDNRPPYAPGFDRGFDKYDGGFHHEGPGQDRYRTVQRRGSEVLGHALAWLAQHPKGPFFIWAHLYDAHDPYTPPEPYLSKYAAEPYDGGIAYEDAAVGKFLQQLKARGLYDGTVIAITADHGESLGAHGEDTHGIFLYDETIQVPLLIKLPRGAATPKRVETKVELVDILPTLLQSAGVAIPHDVQGQSLLPLMTANAGDSGEPSREWSAYAESEYPHSELGWSALRSLRAGKYYFIDAPRRELYDTTADPKEEHNVARGSAAVADVLKNQLDAFRKKTADTQHAPTTKAVLDASAQAALGALGYMASNNNQSNDSHEQGPDPKDKIEIANLIHRAELLEQATHSNEAVALLKQVIQKEPGLALYGKMGDWLVREKRYQDAVPYLRKAMEMNRNSPIEHLQLAKALLALKDFENAIPELEITEARMPELADAHFLLEMAYVQTNRVQDVLREANIILQFAPDHYPSYLILGRFLELSGDRDGAIASLKKASALEPKAPDPHELLAEVYEHMGRKSDAAREHAVAKRLGWAPADQASPAPGTGSGSPEKH